MYICFLIKNVNMMKRILVSFIAFFVASSGFSQTGPAGVGDATNNAVWIDASRVLLTNGLSVALLPDYSGNGNNFTQNTSAKHPIFTTSAVNGLPAIEFDGVDDRLDASSISSIESASITYSVVYQRALLTDQCLISADYTSLPGTYPKWLTYSNAVNDKLITAQYSPTISHENYIDNGSFSFVTVRIFPTYFEIYQDGQLMATKVANYTQPSGHTLLTLGALTSSTITYFLDGFIAEAFVYNEALNDLELDILHNYLGAKYNIAPFVDRYSYEATHNIEVIGLGDDGTDIHDNSKSSGVLRISNPTSMATSEYMFAGHSGDIITVLSTNVPVSLPTYSRWERTWRIDETGDLGDVTIEFDLSQGNNFGSSASYRLLQDTDGDFSNATAISGTYDAVTKTMTFTLNPTAGDYITLAGIAQILNINSIASGNWSSPSTWDCNCVPGLADSAIVKPLHTVTLDTDAEIYNLTIESGGAFDVNANNNIDIHGNLDIQGDLNITDGSFSFVGNVDQEITAYSDTISFLDMTILTYDTGSVMFTDGTYIIDGTLEPVFGEMIIDNASPAKFIINSTSTSTGGRIGEVFSGFTLTGDITVRRFLPAGPAGNAMLASPVIGATLSQWDDSLQISGFGFPDGCAYGDTSTIATFSSCYFSVKTYFVDHYIDITNSNEPLTNGLSFEVFTGDDLTTFSGTTLEVSGGINLTDVTTTTTSGWKFVGNPYASPVLFSQASTTNSLQKYFYVYDHISGAWQWYDKVSGTSSIPSLADGLIASGQGVWVHGFGFLTFPQSSKTSNSATFIRNQELTDEVNLVLSQDNSTFFSQMSIAFDNSATDGIDELDIHRLATGTEKASSLYMTFGEESITKNYVSDNEEDKTFDLTFNCLNEAYYTINIADLAAFGPYKNIYLIDHETNEMVNLTEENYTFFSGKGEFNRFTIVLSNTTISSKEIFNTGVTTTDNLSIVQMGNVLNLSSDSKFSKPVALKLINTLGQEVSHTILDLESGSQVITLSDDLSGVFLVVVTTEYGTTSKKIILQ